MTKSKGIRGFKSGTPLWSRKTYDANGCWNFIGGRNDDGYGTFFHCGARRLAHRVSFALQHGRSERDLALICHTCDNRICINPDHLFEGDHDANNADRDAKHRTAKGEGIKNAVLNPSIVRDIRARLAQGQAYRLVAKEIGVSAGAVYSVKSGKTWKHVE